MSEPATGTAHLKPRARILRTFGDELISSETVAVIELVKNSYDADATKVLIRFTPPLEAGAGAIDVIDDGHGMSTDIVTSAWMEPATLFRAQGRRSEKLGRRVLGEKGIGRFAASRLAERLVMTTRRPEAEFETTALFDWAQFDDPDRYLEDVEVLWEEAEPKELTESGALAPLLDADGEEDKSNSNHGTVLHMEGLRTDWERDRFETLHRALSRLRSPFDSQSEGGPERFQIMLDAPEPAADLSGEIGPVEALQNPEYLLKGSVAADGTCEFRIRIGRGNQEKQITGQLKTANREIPTCGPLELELRVWDRDADVLRSLAKEQGLGVRDFRRELDEFSGVSIYRDGFRVFPYGESGDDWLGLDARRVNQPSRRLSNNQIAGYVSISHEENPGLVDQTNREGLMQNRQYEDLQDLMIGALQLLEDPRARRRKDARERSKERKHEGKEDQHPLDDFDLQDLRDYILSKTGEDSDVKEAFDQKQRDVEAGVGEMQDLLGTYRHLASLGRLGDAILHDGRGPLSIIDGSAKLGLRKIEEFKRTDAVSRDSVKRFTRIRHQADVLDALFKRIQPFANRKRGRRKKVVLEDLVRETFDLEETRVADLGVEVDLPATKTGFSVEETDIRIVLYNLADNALYWLKDVPKDERRIVVKLIKSEDESVQILFSDSGPGVVEEDRDLIFDPYFSRKVNGWGIGLSHAADLMREYYNGGIEMVDEGPLSGATFLVTLRRRT